MSDGKRTVIKQLPKITFYSDDTILLKDIRASYPHLDKPWSMADGNEKKFSITGLIPKTPSTTTVPGCSTTTSTTCWPR
jgi:hypothetical protein